MKSRAPGTSRQNRNRRTAVVPYVRVSSKEQGFSTAAQRQLSGDYAKPEGIRIQEFEDVEAAKRRRKSFGGGLTYEVRVQPGSHLQLLDSEGLPGWLTTLDDFRN